MRIETATHNRYLLKGLYKRDKTISSYSGLPSERINLSPFTKDFRGGGHVMSMK